jgi:hypothetical protein
MYKTAAYRKNKTKQNKTENAKMQSILTEVDEKINRGLATTAGAPTIHQIVACGCSTLIERIYDVLHGSAELAWIPSTQIITPDSSVEESRETANKISPGTLTELVENNKETTDIIDMQRGDIRTKSLRWHRFILYKKTSVAKALALAAVLKEHYDKVESDADAFLEWLDNPKEIARYHARIRLLQGQSEAEVKQYLDSNGWSL